jgi:hypothetical protein
MKFGGCDKTQEMNDKWDKYVRDLWVESEATAPQEEVVYILGEPPNLPL